MPVTAEGEAEAEMSEATEEARPVGTEHELEERKGEPRQISVRQVSPEEEEKQGPAALNVEAVSASPELRQPAKPLSPPRDPDQRSEFQTELKPPENVLASQDGRLSRQRSEIAIEPALVHNASEVLIHNQSEVLLQ